MPSESELRSRMRDAGEPHAELDVARVIRRARLRRLPRILAIGGAACLTVAAVVVPVSMSLLNAPGTGTAFVATDEAGGEAAPESSTGDTLLRAPADKVNLCAGPVAEPTPAASGLELTIAPIDAPADATLIEAVVTLANNGPATVRGTTGGTPALTLSQDGLVLWHSNGPTTMIAVDVDLDPGESMQYVGSFEPVRCGAEDDADPSGFRPGLPPVGPGEYALSAAIDVSLVDGVSPELVTGPPTTVVLR